MTNVSCPDCGRALRPQAIMCPACGHRLLGPPVQQEPTAAAAWEAADRDSPSQPGRSPWALFRGRPERPELAGVGLVVGVAALGIGFLPLQTPRALPIVFGALAIALGLLAGGVNTAGMGAILLGAYIILSPLLFGVVFGSSKVPTFTEPVSVPAGYGLRFEPRPQTMEHIYLGETVSTTKDGWQAARALIGVYSGELTEVGWTVEHAAHDPTGTSIIATDPSTHEQISAQASLAAPSGLGKPPIELQFIVAPECLPGTRLC